MAIPGLPGGLILRSHPQHGSESPEVYVHCVNWSSELASVNAGRQAQLTVEPRRLGLEVSSDGRGTQVGGGEGSWGRVLNERKEHQL